MTDGGIILRSDVPELIEQFCRPDHPTARLN